MTRPAIVTTCLLLAALAPAVAQAEPIEINSFDGGVYLQDGDPSTQAGAHPWTGKTVFYLRQKPGAILPTPYGTLRNTLTSVPAGVIGNPNALPKCSASTKSIEKCPDSTQVGYARLGSSPTSFGSYYPVYNMEPPPGTPAVFMFNILGAPIQVVAKVRTGSDYGLSFGTVNAAASVAVSGVEFVFWGVPADPAHDSERGTAGAGVASGTCADPSQPPTCSNPSTAPIKPFLSNPTSCVGPVDTFFNVTSWEGDEDNASFLSHDNTLPVPNPIGADGCNALDFSPSLLARPTTNVADSPSGLDVTLHVPQNQDPEGTTTAHLRDTVVTLPEGMTVNPSSANGLEGCTEAQADLFSEEASKCPDASKLGTVSVDTPLLPDPVPGSVYLATPYENPSNSLIALYIAIDDPISGTVVKIPGSVDSDPVTGQLTARFLDNPQLPFEDFNLHFFGGAGGSLRTPATCGTYTTRSTMTPWSYPDTGPPVQTSDSYAIEQSPGGGTCPRSDSARPHAPSFDAGTVSPLAGTSSPLVVNLRREDGSQQFSSLTLTPPPGLVGKLAGLPYCPQAALDAAAAKTGREEQANPSCPAASRVGTVTAAAGAGPAPYYAPGEAYLTGPYKGAPLSLVIVTPAAAGPFDLGTIVVRTALHVDSKTAQITAISDPIPSIIDGITLDVRSIQVNMDRPDFTINPSSCNPTSFAGSMVSTFNQLAPLQSRFQVGECGRLDFEPKMRLSLKGGTKRLGHPALTAVLMPRPGDANIAGVSVALPSSELLDQGHIGTVCTRVQFAADKCPEASIYGQARVSTPLLDYELSGPVYLRSSNNTLPDLVPDLRGPAVQPIKLEAAGRTDSINGGIRNTFDAVPDAPFTKFTLTMQGGNKGLLQNSTNICKKVFRATVKFTAHNGLRSTARPPLKANCGKAKKSKKRSKRRAHRRATR